MKRDNKMKAATATNRVSRQRRMSKIVSVTGALLMMIIHAFVAREARADNVIVDFSVLSTSTVPITLQNNPSGLTLNGVNMTYDNYGSPADFANADSAGINGTTYGPLIFNFTAPATAMNLGFSVTGVPGPDPNTLISSFSLAGVIVDTVTVAGTFGGGQINGLLAYAGGPGILFDQATMYYTIPNIAPPGYAFTTQNISYVSTVPEPAALALLGLGTGGLLLFRRLRERHECPRSHPRH